MTNILITGGAGFIGSNFVRYWNREHPQDKITVLDKLTYAGNLANIQDLVRSKTIKFIKGDIVDQKVVRKAMAGQDVVVHFAAESHVDRSINDPFVFTRSNILGTHVLLETARELKTKRFHLISTDEVFGSIPLEKHWKFNEETKYNPNNHYAASKAACDHLARVYFETYGVPVTISNCSNNFGAFQYPEKFIPRSVIRLLNGENLLLYTPGNQIRDWLYVEDHCRAIDLILEKGVIGETYCIGGLQTGISNMEVSKTILGILELPESRIELITDRPGHDVKYDIDWTKINRELGWEPKHNFEIWLRVTIEWYKRNKDWWQKLYQESEAFYGN